MNSSGKPGNATFAKDQNMLPKVIDNNEPYTFMSSPDRLSLLFASKLELEHGGLIQPLWVRETANARTLQALLRWVAVRRDLWTAWGKLATTVGHVAIARHIERLLEASPLREVVGTFVYPHDDDACTIILGETLAGGAGLAFDTLYLHRFASPQMRERFFTRFNTGDNNRAAEELVHIGYNIGTDTVGDLLDRIAAEMPTAAPAHTTPEARFAGRRRRTR